MAKKKARYPVTTYQDEDGSWWIEYKNPGSLRFPLEAWLEANDIELPWVVDQKKQQSMIDRMCNRLGNQFEDE